MKNFKHILLYSLLLLPAAGKVFAGAVHGPNYFYATKGSDNGVYITSYTAGDTIALQASQNPYSYVYIDVSGTAAAPIVIINDGGQVQLTDGFSIQNSNYLRVLGTGSADQYGFAITQTFNGGVPLVINGMCDSIEIESISAQNGVGGFWDKTEVSDVQNQYGCNIAYLYPMHMMHHHIHYCKFFDIQGDVGYIGSTGSVGGRPMTCNGVTTDPRPAGMGYIEFDHNIIDSANRTGCQVSGSDSGWNRIHDNTILNMGYEYNTAQGGGIELGSLTYGANVYNNHINKTFLYNFVSYAGGSVNFYNNFCDSAGYVGATQNSQAIPSVVQAMAYNATGFTKTLVTINYANDTMGVNSSSGNVNIAVYGDTSGMTATGNVVCNSGILLNSTSPVIPISTACNVTQNAPPVANAGNDTTITLPASSIILNSSKSTDASGHITSYVWTEFSGPSAYTITSPDSAKTTVTGLTAGVYVFQLKVTDNLGSTGTDTMSVKVNAQPPVANAGIDQAITLPASSVTLSGSKSTDPDGHITTYTWTKFSGPSTYTITAPSSDTTTITGLTTAGVYVFQLQVTDNFGLTNTDTVSITVNGQAQAQSPLANAGIDQAITLPVSTVLLNGSSSTTPSGTITGYTWTEQSGPSTATILSPSSDTTTILGLLSSGVYVFQLKVTNNSGLSSTDTMSVIVNAQAQAISYVSTLWLNKVNGTTRYVTVQPNTFTSVDYTMSGIYVSSVSLMNKNGNVKQVSLQQNNIISIGYTMSPNSAH
jgi:hypothetical protein